VVPVLRDAFLDILRADDSRRLVLLGRGAREFARLHLAPAASSRIFVPEDLSPDEIATHLSACDVVVQPYGDGVSARRTTVMASLALGVPVITTEGQSTEPIWRESGGVAIAAAEAIPATVGLLDSDRELAHQLGRRGQELYRQHFAIERAVSLLRDPLEAESKAR
jgi:glycosyltransferase involved in cell wall biosynthesis